MKEEEKDLKALKEKDKLEMLKILKEKLPTNLKNKINAMIKKDPKGWSTSIEVYKGIPSPFHFREGMDIRNLLRIEGFTEDKLGINNLDNIYSYLVEESLK